MLRLTDIRLPLNHPEIAIKNAILKRINISEKDLVQKKEVVVTITDKGYCKRMDVQTYREQKRGGKGVIGS